MSTVFEFEGRSYLVMETKEQADELVSDDLIQDILEGWFADRRTVPEEAFIDKLSDTYGTPRHGEVGFEIQNYDSAAARRLLSRARKIKRELND